METPPTTMIHSPCGTFAAETGRVKARKIATRRNRFAMNFGAALFMHRALSATGGWKTRFRVSWTGRKRVPPFHSGLDLVPCEIFQGLTFTNQRDSFSAHQSLSRQRA